MLSRLASRRASILITGESRPDCSLRHGLSAAWSPLWVSYALEAILMISGGHLVLISSCSVAAALGKGPYLGDGLLWGAMGPSATDSMPISAPPQHMQGTHPV